MTPRETDITVDYRDEDGKAHSVALRVRAVGDRDRDRRARIKANLAGVPWDHLTPDDQVFFGAVATVGVGVVNVDELPEWLRDDWPRSLLKHPSLAIDLALFIGRHTRDYFRDQIRATGRDASEPQVRIRAGSGGGGD